MSASIATTGAPAPPGGLIIVRERGKSEERQIADLIVAGVGANALTTHLFHSNLPSLSPQECMASLCEASSAIAAGDLSAAEQMLAAQAVTLNSIFTEMARKAAEGMGSGNLQRTETYMRMALKAQSQSRCTVETLAAIKQGPAIFAKQANIANGGPQQVNNGPSPGTPEMGKQQRTSPVPAGARKRTGESVKTQLLEARRGKRMDGRAKGAASGIDSDMAAVEVVDRATNARRKSTRSDARGQGRAGEADPRAPSRPSGRAV